jgi:hypothetical protein
MRLAVTTALGAAALAATAGAVVGWHYAPGSTEVRTHLVSAKVPTGPPVYVEPECTVTPQAAFQPSAATPPGSESAGRVPSGFIPVRAVRCETAFQTGTFTVTQSETSTDGDLRAVLAALRPPRIPEPTGPVMVCPAIASVPVTIALVDARGTAVRVDLPRDRCGLYVEPALRTLDTVHWTVTKTTQAPLP